MDEHNEREAHIRRMIAHGEKLAEKFKRDNAEFEAGCRKFWDLMRRHQIEAILSERKDR